MGTEDTLLGVIPLAVEANIINKVIGNKPSKRKSKKSKGLTFD